MSQQGNQHLYRRPLPPDNPVVCLRVHPLVNPRVCPRGSPLVSLPGRPLVSRLCSQPRGQQVSQRWPLPDSPPGNLRWPQLDGLLDGLRVSPLCSPLEYQVVSPLECLRRRFLPPRPLLVSLPLVPRVNRVFSPRVVLPASRPQCHQDSRPLNLVCRHRFLRQCRHCLPCFATPRVCRLLPRGTKTSPPLPG